MERKALELTQAEHDFLRALPLELDEFWGRPADPSGELHNRVARAFARHLAERGLAEVRIPSPGRFVISITEAGVQALAIRDALDE